jgi:uncharacterized protein YqhQ
MSNGKCKDEDEDEDEDEDDGEVVSEHKNTTLISESNINIIKVALFLFILFLFLHSNVFIDRFLSFPDSTFMEGREVTTKGIITQGVLLSTGHILINILVNNDCV